MVLSQIARYTTPNSTSFQPLGDSSNSNEYEGERTPLTMMRTVMSTISRDRTEIDGRGGDICLMVTIQNELCGGWQWIIPNMARIDSCSLKMLVPLLPVWERWTKKRRWTKRMTQHVYSYVTETWSHCAQQNETVLGVQKEKVTSKRVSSSERGAKYLLVKANPY
mmetsp:Transcript_40061/g.73295  ORF Transcript_40061/g.73295 Transcript_40061/m.73295 type:complete len:165 (+) Transcript_40061:92-586(+)